MNIYLQYKFFKIKRKIMSVFESYGAPSGVVDNCDAPTVPQAEIADCPNDYNLVDSEIEDIWIVGAVWNDATGKYEAAAKPTVSNSIAGLDGITGVTRIVGIGSKPAATDIESPTLPRGVTFTKNRTHTVSMAITHMPIANYEFIRTLQSGMYVAIWYRVAGDKFFGGNDGIVISKTNSGTVLEAGEGSVVTGNVTFEWNYKYDPPMQDAATV